MDCRVTFSLPGGNVLVSRLAEHRAFTTTVLKSHREAIAFRTRMGDTSAFTELTEFRYVACIQRTSFVTFQLLQMVFFSTISRAQS